MSSKKLKKFVTQVQGSAATFGGGENKYDMPAAVNVSKKKGTVYSS